MMPIRSFPRRMTSGLTPFSLSKSQRTYSKIDALETDIGKLEGVVLGSGVQDIKADAKDIITLKCSSCGAEVVIDTKESAHARCHWCRHTITINEQIPNGAIPDVVLPFSVTKQTAEEKIKTFVEKRKFFALTKFKNEFTTENIMGVYFPYMLVDVNAHANLDGTGEHQTRSYTRGSGDNQRTYYDADLYSVIRDFDVEVDDLTIESSSERLDNSNQTITNNVINSIMPFDTENAVKWNANYIKGFTSEKRDVNIDTIRRIVSVQINDVIRHSANDSLEFYDRGVCWEKEKIDIKGERWKAAYLPVWLYSYQQVSGNKKIIHYVAVNGRTMETMGSVPLDKIKLFLISLLIEIVSFFAYIEVEADEGWILLASGFAYFIFMYKRYRNQDARHAHEKDTKTKVSNLISKDRFITQRKGLSSSRMEGANNESALDLTNRRFDIK